MTPLSAAKRIKIDLVGQVHLHLHHLNSTNLTDQTEATASLEEVARANLSAVTRREQIVAALAATSEDLAAFADRSVSAQAAAVVFIVLVILLFARFVLVDLLDAKALQHLKELLVKRIETHNVLRKKLRRCVEKFVHSNSHKAEGVLLEQMAEFQQFLERIDGCRSSSDSIHDLRGLIVMWLQIFEHFSADVQDLDLNFGADAEYLRELFLSAQARSCSTMIEAFESKDTLSEIATLCLNKHMGPQVGALQREIEEVQDMAQTSQARLFLPLWVSMPRDDQGDSSDSSDSNDEGKVLKEAKPHNGRWTHEGFFPIRWRICGVKVLVHTWWHLSFLTLVVVGLILAAVLHARLQVSLPLAIGVDLALVVLLYMLTCIQETFEFAWTEKYISHLENEMTKVRCLRTVIDSQIARMEGVENLWRYCTTPSLEILAQVQCIFETIHLKGAPENAQTMEAFSTTIELLQPVLDLHMKPLFYGPKELSNRKLKAIGVQLNGIRDLFGAQVDTLLCSGSRSAFGFSSGLSECLDLINERLQAPLYYVTLRLKSIGPLLAGSTVAVQIVCGRRSAQTQAIRTTSHQDTYKFGEDNEYVFKIDPLVDQETSVNFVVKDFEDPDVRCTNLGCVSEAEFKEGPGKWLHKKKEFTSDSLPKTVIEYSYKYGDIASLLDESHDTLLPDIRALKEKLYANRPETKIGLATKRFSLVSDLSFQSSRSRTGRSSRNSSSTADVFTY